MDFQILYNAFVTISNQPIPVILLAVLVTLITQLVKKLIPEKYKSVSVFIPFPFGIGLYAAYIAIVTKGSFVLEEVTIGISKIFSSGAMVGILSIIVYNVIKSIRNIIIEKQLDSEEAQVFFKELVNIIGNRRDTVTIVKKLTQIDWTDVHNCMSNAKTVLSGFIQYEDLDRIVTILKGAAMTIETERNLAIAKKEAKKTKKEKED